MRSVLLIALVLPVALLAAACGDDKGQSATSGATAANATTTEAPRRGGVLTMGVWAQTNGLDPISNFGAGNTGGAEMGAIYDHLVEWNPTKKAYEPKTAESVTPNATSTEWTIKVRPNISFTDGTPYDAPAVKFNFDRQRKDNTTLRGALASISDVAVVDALTVKVTLAEPWTGFPYLLSMSYGMIASPAAVAKGGKDFAINPQDGGAGPFVFVSFRPGEAITLRRNDHYWGGEVFLDGLKFVLVGGGAQTYDSLKTGGVDVALLREPAAIAKSRAEKYGGADVAYSAGELLLVNNGVEVQCSGGKPETLCAGQPDGAKVATKTPGSNPKIRQAIDAALNLTTIDQRANDGAGLPATSLFDKAFPWDPKVAMPAMNIDAAKRLVQEAKTAGWDGKVRLECTNTPPRIATALAIQAALENVGMTVDMKKTNVDVNLVIADVITNKDYDLACWGQQLSPDDYPQLQLDAFLRSTSASNRTGYKNPAMDAALSELKRAQTDAAKTTAYKKIADLWATDIPSIPIAHVEERVAWSPKVHGVATTAQSQALFQNAWIG